MAPRSIATYQRAYAADAGRFHEFVARPLNAVVLGDVQAFADTLSQLSNSTQARRLAALKSLLAFGHQIGYLPFDVARVVKLPPRKDMLASRILPEADVHRLLALEPDHRNRVLLRFLYAAGVRVDELLRLTWADFQPRDGAGQATVYGKGGKTRVVLLPESVRRDLEQLRGDAAATVAAFRSRNGGHLHTSSAWRVVRKAALRAGVDMGVSPHWFRHAHATHALDRGAPIHLVAATLGHATVATTGRYLHAHPSDSSCRYLAI